MSGDLKQRTKTSNGADVAFDRIVERLGELIEVGATDAAMRLIAENPAYAERLRQLLPTIEALASFNNSPLPSSGEGAIELGILGDFRIVREIGRGGMGIVYEAQQISLNRRVALKVLPLAALLDRRRLDRFRHEAQAAAMLRHPHIVTVYSVGCERGVHFYAMEYIEGLSLAEVVEQKRKAESGKWNEEKEVATSALPSSIDKHQSEIVPPSVPLSALRSPLSAADTVAAALSTLPDRDTREYHRTIARLGIQAAEALDYAHQMGVVHRDIKPSNLLIDAQGKLWITDFGLAMTQTDAELTVSGDLMGTLRYMSPEQATGKRLPLDHRTDVYSLGITLYELLAGRPAFDASDRAELLRSIAEVEPTALRKVTPAIPADLETIVHKAIEKEAAERYATAQELADDLRRFVEHRSIQARRPTPVSRLRKFAKRHRKATTFVVAATLLLAVVAAAIWADRRRQLLEAQRFFEASVQTGLVGYWPFDGDGRDRSLLGHDFALQGEPGFAPGLLGQSLDLHRNPNTYAVRLANDPEYNIGGRDFALQVWVKFHSTRAEQALIEKFTGRSGPGWTLTKPESNVFQFFSRGQYNSAPQSIATNAWHHLVALRKDRQIEIWLDGAIIVSFHFYGAADSSSPLTIGRRNPEDTRDFSLDGQLDEVAFWNRALTDEEIAYLYNNGVGNPIVFIAE